MATSPDNDDQAISILDSASESIGCLTISTAELEKKLQQTMQCDALLKYAVMAVGSGQIDSESQSTKMISSLTSFFDVLLLSTCWDQLHEV